MLIDGKHYSWSQPVCTDCWLEENTVVDPEGGLLVRRPIILVPPPDWGDRIERCCKCDRRTTSQIFIRIDPSTVPFPTEDNE